MNRRSTFEDENIMVCWDDEIQIRVYFKNDNCRFMILTNADFKNMSEEEIINYIYKNYEVE